MLCTTTRDIISSSENINSTARVSRVFFSFLWLWKNAELSFIAIVDKIKINKSNISNFLFWEILSIVA